MSVVEDHNCSVPAELGPALAELKPWQWYNWWWTVSKQQLSACDPDLKH